MPIYLDPCTYATDRPSTSHSSNDCKFRSRYIQRIDVRCQSREGFFRSVGPIAARIN